MAKSYKLSNRGVNDNEILREKVPPQSLESEQAVLAAVLMDNYALSHCIEYIRPDDFYKEAHRLIFQSMLELNDKNEPTDLLTLKAHLENKGLLERVGGTPYLSAMTDIVPTSANVVSYAKIVREKSLVRQLIHAGTEIVTRCYEPDVEPQDLVDEAENKIFSIAEKKSSQGFAPVKDLVKSSYKMIEELFERKTDITGLTTGFPDFDKLTAGFQKGDLVIIAGRPSMGKTALSLNMAQNAAKAGAKVAVFSLEMSKESLVMRMLTSEARIDSMRVRTGDLHESDWQKLLDGASKVSEMKMYIDDQAGQTTLEIRAKCRRLARELGGLDMVLIDYLQLMRGATPTNNREQEISEISRSLKALAKELKVPVIALSQLNRSLESRTNKRPMMSDLRESGAIEQDADLISFIYRDEVYSPETPDKGVAEIIVAKQRNGAIGTVRVAYLNQYVRFEPLVYQSEPYGHGGESADFDPGQFAYDPSGGGF